MSPYLRNSIVLVILVAALTATATAQELLIKDPSGVVVNNDTLTYYPELTQKPPYIEISSYFSIQNAGAMAKTVRVKKTDLVLPADADHGFCFAGQCFPSTIFVSPSGVTLTPTQVNSDFSGHYRCLETAAPPEDLVAYTFYDENNTADSAIVYVRYKFKPTSVQPYTPGSVNAIIPFPNPATDQVSFSFQITSPGTLCIINSIGKIIEQQALNNYKGTISANSTGWPADAYHYVFSDSNTRTTGHFIVQH